MARLFVFALLAVATPGLALAQVAASQAPAALTADDYARAERFLAAAVNPLVVGGTVNATWLPDDRFTYRSTTADGVEFMLVDPAKKTRGPAFDHERLAAALATASGTDGGCEEAAVPDHRALGRRHLGGVRRRPASATRAT